MPPPGLQAEADQPIVMQFRHLEARALITDTVPVYTAYQTLDVIREPRWTIQSADREIADA